MKVLKKADQKAVKLWLNANHFVGKYRLFKYLITKEVSQGQLMLNTVSGELIFLDKNDLDKLLKLPRDYEPWMNQLIEEHFLVKDDFDDKVTIDTFRQAFRMMGITKTINGYVVFPTTCCNARCFYCYESNIIHKNMSDETAEKLVNFIDKHRGEKPVVISWFGGEPLVGIKQIDRISSILKNRNIPFFSRMTSNGYLFNEQIAKRAKEEWCLEKIQITLDGTEKIYNKTKAYINPCESPFKKVLQNIGYLLKNDIEVEIRMNLGTHNGDDLSALIDEISYFAKISPKIKAHIHILFDGCGFNPIHFTEEEITSLYEKQRELEDKMLKYCPTSYEPPLPTLTGVHCNVDTSSLVVFPDGKLGKCQHFADSHYVGDLDHGVTNFEELEFFKKRSNLPQCPNCPFYPCCDKLENCEIDHSCSDIGFKFKKKKVLQAMDYYYEKFLKAKNSEKL